MNSILHLEVNDSGDWRRVMSFDARAADEVATHSTWLFGCGNGKKLRARIVAAGATVPVRTWTRSDGWQPAGRGA